MFAGGEMGLGGIRRTDFRRRDGRSGGSMLGWSRRLDGDSRYVGRERLRPKAAGDASLTAAKDGRTRVGVIGLGRLWETRHKPALARLGHRFEVTAVYDQVARRAALEAGQLGCVACEGLAALIDRADVNAVQILAPQWFGIHAIELACAARKPIYCALPLAGDPDDLEALAAFIESSGAAFVPELARRFYPATLRLRELLATRLGAPRLILGQIHSKGFDRYGRPGPSNATLPRAFVSRSGRLFDRLVSLCFSGRADRRARLFCATSTRPPATRRTIPTSNVFIWISMRGEPPKSPSADINMPLGATRRRSCPRRGFRCSPSAARLGWKCPTTSFGPIREGSTMKNSRRTRRRRGADRPFSTAPSRRGVARPRSARPARSRPDR